jgi:hypothetical protein
VTTYGALVENLVSGAQLGDTLNHMDDRVSHLEHRTSEVNRLESLSNDLGLMLAGEFRTGNGEEPGNGFTGGRFGYPGFSYNSETWLLAAVLNDVLQVGINLTTGKLLAAAGGVILDVDGITINAPENFDRNIYFKDGSATLAELDAGWVSGGASGLGIYGIAKTASEHGYIALVGYNNDRSANVNLELRSTGACELDLDTASTDTLHSQKFEIITDINDGNDMNDTLVLSAKSKAAVAAGLGAAMAIWVENSAGSLVKAGRIGANWKTATAASEVGRLSLQTKVGGADVEQMSIDNVSVQTELPVTAKQAVAISPASGYTALKHGTPYEQLNVSNTAAKTTIYTTSIAANALGDDGFIDVDIPFRYSNNSGAARNLTFTVDFGSTAAISYTISAIAASANPRTGRIRLSLSNADATNSQRAYFEAYLSAAVAVGTATPRGGLLDDSFEGTAAEDTTSAKTLTISVTHSAADAALSFRSLGARVDGPYTL